MADSLPDRTKAASPQSAKRHRAAASQVLTPTDFPVVGIGASAGGLKACIKLFDALPAETGMAFILVQHLDPTHESMMVELLAAHTSLIVQQADDGTIIEVDNVYVITPGTYLSVSSGTIHLTAPKARRGARLPFDFLLHSLAETYVDRTACVVLSGTGADGSEGLRSVHGRAGLVLAQCPTDADFDGMPQSAIGTGLVDMVLPAAEIPAALAKHFHAQPEPEVNGRNPPGAAPRDWLAEIVELVRARTGHDFTLYKPGTLKRRIERRMTMASLGSNDQCRYLDTLRTDPSELNQLAEELLINVTSFFRDPDVFALLSEKVVPVLVREHSTNGPIRIWIAGCSTGEEVYSLAMLFCEQIAAAMPETRTASIKLQIFASDIDADAVATAREGFYPLTIEAQISAARLARFFAREDGGYRVLPGLRATVVFTVQDVLTDPPFSRLDVVSCRNLLIYLSAEAQARVINRLHFALKEGGLLLLGNAETAGDRKDKFKTISKSARLYRHIGRSQPGDFMVGERSAGSDRASSRPRAREGRSREAILLELCSEFLLETHVPATVVSNRKHEYLFSIGPIDRYLRVTPGQPTNDLLSMVRKGTRSKLLLAVQQASHGSARVTVSGGRRTEDGHPVAFRIDVQPVLNEDEELLLISFVDEPRPRATPASRGDPQDSTRNAELERELDLMRAEMQAAVFALETSDRAHKTADAEALSANEEFQATNEELLASKEELQSLNEELTALNSQLHET
jgi:two-component system CheB/CheR fusion protein